MRRGSEIRLELRRREVNAFGQHPVEKFSEPPVVTFHCVGEAPDRLVGEIRAEH